MYVLFLLFMGLIIGFVAYPFARSVGWSYGRWGRGTDMVLVIVVTIVVGVLVTLIASALGAAIDPNAGALVGGFIGAMLAVGGLVLFSLKASSDEPNTTKEPLPGEDTPA